MAIKVTNPDNIDKVIAKYLSVLNFEDPKEEYRKAFRDALIDAALDQVPIEHFLKNKEITIGFLDRAEKTIMSDPHSRLTATTEVGHIQLRMLIKRWMGDNLTHISIEFELESLS